MSRDDEFRRLVMQNNALREQNDKLQGSIRILQANTETMQIQIDELTKERDSYKDGFDDIFIKNVGGSWDKIDEQDRKKMDLTEKVHFFNRENNNTKVYILEQSRKSYQKTISELEEKIALLEQEKNNIQEEKTTQENKAKMNGEIPPTEASSAKQNSILNQINKTKPVQKQTNDIVKQLSEMNHNERAMLNAILDKKREFLGGTTDITHATKGFSQRSIILGLIGVSGESTREKLTEFGKDKYNVDVSKYIYAKLGELVREELVEEREVNVGGTGRPPKHYALTQKGKYIYTQDNGQNPAESKIDQSAREQKSSAHGLGILKIVDILIEAGYECRKEVIRTATDGSDVISDIEATKNGRIYYLEYEEGNYNEEGYFSKFERIASITPEIIFIARDDEAKKKISIVYKKWVIQHLDRIKLKNYFWTIAYVQKNPTVLEDEVKR